MEFRESGIIGKMNSFGKAVGLLAAVLLIAGCKSGGGVIGKETKPVDPTIHLKKVTYAEAENGTLVKIYGSRQFSYTTYKLLDPLRLAVEIPNVVLDFKPQRIGINDKNISHIAVVRFPKVNSVRIEMELFADLPFEINKKKDHLEILVSERAAPLFSPAETSLSETAWEEAPAFENETGIGKSIEELERENQELRLEVLEARKTIIDLEKENRLLWEQAEEAQRQLEETGSMTETLQARIIFMENQLSKIQTQLAGKLPSPGSSGRSKETASVTIPRERKPAVSLSIKMAEEKQKGERRAEAKPEIQPMPTLAPEAVRDEKVYLAENEIGETVTGWLSAWNDENMETYAGFYSPAFKFGRMDRERWLSNKKAKFEREGKHSIFMNNLKIIVNGTSAKAVYLQKYRSTWFNSTGRKTLTFSKETNGWKIVSEMWSSM